MNLMVSHVTRRWVKKGKFQIESCQIESSQKRVRLLQILKIDGKEDPDFFRIYKDWQDDIS